MNMNNPANKITSSHGGSNTRYIIQTLLISGVLLSNPVLADTQLNAVNDRITDQAIKADQATYTAIQARIAAQNNAGIPVADYRLSKAQCWLDVSFHEYTRNDRSAFTQEALNQANAILTSLEQNTTPNPAHETPLVNDADKLREDLWAKSDALKHGKGIACYAQQLACAEVELVHAGNEHKQQGWRHAKPYIQLAEDLIADAEMIGDTCLPAPVAIVDPAPVVDAPPVVEAPPPAIVEVENIELQASALFKFDKYQDQDLLAEGKHQLDTLAEKLQQNYIHIDSIKLIGYTDRLGSEKYNQTLSERRALTVKQYLQAKGVNHVIEAYGKGEADPIETCGTTEKRSALLKSCLQRNRRVAVEIKGIKKTNE